MVLPARVVGRFMAIGRCSVASLILVAYCHGLEGQMKKQGISSHRTWPIRSGAGDRCRLRPTGMQLSVIPHSESLILYRRDEQEHTRAYEMTKSPSYKVVSGTCETCIT